METAIKVKDKEGRKFVVQAVEGTYTKEVDKGIKWGFEYRIHDSNNQQVGEGHFGVNCSADHIHLKDEEIYTILLKIGAQKVKGDIDNNSMPESTAYNISVSNCQE